MADPETAGSSGAGGQDIHRIFNNIIKELTFIDRNLTAVDFGSDYEQAGPGAPIPDAYRLKLVPLLRAAAGPHVPSVDDIRRLAGDLEKITDTGVCSLSRQTGMLNEAIALRNEIDLRNAIDAETGPGGG